jgi:YfiH family protein
MITRKTNGLSFSQFLIFLKYNELGHFVTTRWVRDANRSSNSFDLSFNTDKKLRTVLDNRQRLSVALKIPLSGITTAKQVHGNRVRIVDESMKGKGARDPDDAIEITDALVTDVTGVCPMILVADCVPVLLYDPKKKVVGAVHAGWKGTLGCIAKKTVEVFQERFGSSPEDMVAGIGPSIGPCCFQVGPEVVIKAKDVFGAYGGFVKNLSADGSGYFDLWEANKKQLIESGLDEKNVEVAGVCTCCDPSRLYFSHRGEKGKAGRFGAGIFIR